MRVYGFINLDAFVKSPKNADMSLRAKRGNPWPRPGNDPLESMKEIL